MQRDMSYELDGIFASRNAGELVTVQQTRTKVVRSPGLAPAARMPGGDVRNLTPALGRPMPGPRPRNIDARLARNLDPKMARTLGLPMYRNPGDLAGAEISLPVIGTVTVGALALAALAGFAVYKLAR